MSDPFVSAGHSSHEFPKIRPVEAFPYQDGNRQFICLRDPQNIAKNVLSLPIPAYFIVTLMDGNHSLFDIQEAFVRQFHEMIPQESISKIIDQLDSELYLESDKYLQAVQKIEEEFHTAPYREPAHAGIAYENDTTLLHEQCDNYLAAVKGITRNESLPTNGSISVLVAPHIDLQRGKDCYALAYEQVIQRPPSDLYIIFGTAHQSRGSLLALTRKSYNTPFGPVETDCEFVECFSQIAPSNVFEEELLHRDEHSIEFQVLFLRYALGPKWQGKIVPILTGSFHPYIHSGKSPREDSMCRDILDALRECVKEYDGKVTVIAGADMSHVGKKFGHPHGIPPSELERVEQEDGDVLDAMLTGEAEVFYRSVEKQKDRNNICGLSPIFMALDVARPQKGYLLKYDQAIDQMTESVVSFAGVCFFSG